MARVRKVIPQVHIGQFGVKDVEVIQVVRTTLLHRGTGTEETPHRHITQFWSLDGDLLAEVDPHETATMDPGIVRQGTGW